MKVSNLCLMVKETGKFNCNNSIMDADDARDFLNTVMDLGSLDREHFVVVHMNARGKPTGFETVAIGGVNSCYVDAKYVFKSAIVENAYGVLVAHNHPSGDISPSQQDKAVTKRLNECGELLGIKLVDSLIVGGNNVYSFRENGELDKLI